MASPVLMAPLSLIVPFLAGKFRAWRSGMMQNGINLFLYLRALNEVKVVFFCMSLS